MSFINVGFFLAFVAWAVALISIVASMHLGRKAARHLPRTEQDNYLRNVMLLPNATHTVELLKGQNTDLHPAVATHALRVWKAGLAFMAVGLAMLVISIIIRSMTTPL